MTVSNLLVAAGIYVGGTIIATEQSVTDSVGDFPHPEPWILPTSEESGRQVGWLVIPMARYGRSDSVRIEIIGRSKLPASFPSDTTSCDKTGTSGDQAGRGLHDIVIRNINIHTGDVLVPLCGELRNFTAAPLGLKLLSFHSAGESQKIVALKAIHSPAKPQPLDHPLASGIVVGIFSLIVAFMGFAFNQRLQKQTYQNELAKREIEVGLEIFQTVDLDISGNIVRLEHFLHDAYNSPQVLEQNAATVLHRPEFSDYLKRIRGAEYVDQLKRAYGNDFREYGLAAQQWGDQALQTAERNRLRERLRELAKQLKANFETLQQ